MIKVTKFQKEILESAIRVTKDVMRFTESQNMIFVMKERKIKFITNET